MLLAEAVRLFSGYVKFSAHGGFCERFVNLCDNQKINIRSLGFNNEKLEGFVSAKDYKKLRPIAKKSGMKLCCVSKHGLPFFVFKKRNRVGLLIGAVFFAVFMCIMSLFIWNVETIGSEKISSEEILFAAKELGLKEGSFRPKTDVHALSDGLITKFGGRLLWAAVNVNGSRAVIEVRDYIEKPESKTYSDPCNIVADFDGLLLSLEVFNGTKANSEGNGVKKGDLLISGIVENRDFSSSFHEARGKITALHKSEISLLVPSKSSFKKYTHEKNVFFLRFFWFKIPLGIFKKDENFEEFESEKKLTLNGMTLPFSVIKKTRVYFEEKSEETGFELERAADALTVSGFEKYKNTLVLKTKFMLSKTKEGVLANSKSECIDFIGKKQKLLITEHD